MSRFSFFDGFIFIFIFLLTVFSVFISRIQFKKENGTVESRLEILLMGRKITLPFFIISLVASWYGEISGVTAFTFEHGVFSFFTQGVVWYVVYLLFVGVIIPRIPENSLIYQVSTFPELVGKIFGPRSRKITAILNVLSLLPIASVLGLGIFIQFIFGFSLFTSSAIGLFSVFSYSLSGGLRTVVFADLIQFIAMMSAVFLVVLFSVIHYGSPFQLSSHLPVSYFQWDEGKGIFPVMIWGFIALVTLVDPLFYQRVLAARSNHQAKIGILSATLIWFFFDCSTTLGALYARAYFPKLNPNESYLVFSLSILPSGLRGLMLAGVFSAIISSLDSHLFSAAGIIVNDLMPSSQFTKRRFQYCMLITGVFALLLTPLFEGNIALVWKVLGSLSSSCLLFPWLLELIFSREKNEFRFLASITGGILLMIAGGGLIAFKLTDVDSFYFGFSGSMMGYVAAVVLNKFHTKFQ